MLCVFYISGHGFGHASRNIELIRAIRAQRAGARFIVRTSVRPSLFDLAPEVIVQPFETDPGIAQIDSLHIDETETAGDRRAAVALPWRR